MLLSALMRARTGAQLRQSRERAERLLQRYLDDAMGMGFIAAVMSAINDTLIRRALALALEAMALQGAYPPVPFCWLSLGSEGREEQLLRTDQDNALIYADPPSDDVMSPQGFFLALATRVTGLLEEAGFEACPAEMMARSAAWCQPLSRWQARFAAWIREPEPTALMKANIFFDFRPVDGDASLAAQLRERIVAMVHGLVSRDLRAGVSAEQAAEAFLDFVGGDVLVGHHAAFDVRMMNGVVDTARLAHRLELGPLAETSCQTTRRSLDALAARYALSATARDTAVGDALLTAMVPQRQLHAVHKVGVRTLGALLER